MVPDWLIESLCVALDQSRSEYWFSHSISHCHSHYSINVNCFHITSVFPLHYAMCSVCFHRAYVFAHAPLFALTPLTLAICNLSPVLLSPSHKQTSFNRCPSSGTRFITCLASNWLLCLLHFHYSSHISSIYSQFSLGEFLHCLKSWLLYSQFCLGEFLH